LITYAEGMMHTGRVIIVLVMTREKELLTALEEALSDTYQEMVEATERLSVVRQQLQAYQSLVMESQTLGVLIQKLQTEYQGLQSALDRRRGNDEATEPDPVSWASLSRPVAVLHVLAEAEQPLGPSEITERLQSHGRDDSRKGVSVALMRLQKKGQARAASRGQWLFAGGQTQPVLYGEEVAEA
jgi:hypothetical protein